MVELGMPTRTTSTNRGMGFFGIPQQNYSSYFQPVVSPMPTTYADPYAVQGTTDFQIANRLAENQANAYNELANYDPEDEESVNGLQRLMALGQVPSATGNALLRQSRYYNPMMRSGSSRNSPFSDEGTAFLNHLYSIDWTQPNAFKALPQLLQQHPNALSDPRVSSAMQAVQQHALSYKPAKPQSEDEIAQLPTHLQSLAGKAIANLANAASGFGSEQSGDEVMKNRRLILSSMRFLRGAGVPDQRINNELLAAGLDPDEWQNGSGPSSGYSPSEEEKKKWLTARGVDPDKLAANDPLWQQAYYGAQGTQMPQPRTVKVKPVEAAPAAPGLQGDEFTSAKATPVAPTTSDHEEPEFASAEQPAGLQNIQKSIQAIQQAPLEKERQLEAKRVELSPTWEARKQDFYSSIPQEWYSKLQLGLPVDYEELTKAAGKNPNEELFKDERGNPVTWQQIAYQAINDPRFRKITEGAAPQALQSGQTIQAAPGVTIRAH